MLMLKWYREHLAKDFLVIESDGSILNKAESLAATQTIAR
jgi:hypothetical protein